MSSPARRWIIIATLAITGSLILTALVSYTTVDKIKEIANQTGVIRYVHLSKIVVMMESLEEAFKSLEFLAFSNMDANSRKQEHKKISSAMEKYRSYLNDYSAMNLDSKEEEIRKHIVPILESWKEEIQRGVELARSIDTLGIIDPRDVEVQLLAFKAEHETLEARTVELVYAGKMFSGGDDPPGCRLGRWFDSFQTNNQELEKSLKLASERDRRFHQTIWEIKSLMHLGKVAEARALLSTVRANKELIFNHINEINMLIVKEADSKVKEFQSHLANSVSEKRALAWKAFEEYIDTSERLAKRDLKLILAYLREGNTVFGVWLLLGGSLIGAIFYKLYRY